MSLSQVSFSNIFLARAVLFGCGFVLSLSSISHTHASPPPSPVGFHSRTANVNHSHYRYLSQSAVVPARQNAALHLPNLLFMSVANICAMNQQLREQDEAISFKKDSRRVDAREKTFRKQHRYLSRKAKARASRESSHSEPEVGSDITSQETDFQSVCSSSSAQSTDDSQTIISLLSSKDREVVELGEDLLTAYVTRSIAKAYHHYGWSYSLNRSSKGTLKDAIHRFVISVPSLKTDDEIQESFQVTLHTLVHNLKLNKLPKDAFKKWGKAKRDAVIKEIVEQSPETVRFNQAVFGVVDKLKSKNIRNQRKPWKRDREDKNLRFVEDTYLNAELETTEAVTAEVVPTSGTVQEDEEAGHDGETASVASTVKADWWDQEEVMEAVDALVEAMVSEEITKLMQEMFYPNE